MGKLKNSGGFTLVETLVVMSALLVMSSVFSNIFNTKQQYVESIESLQIKSMFNMQRVFINDRYWFNRNGNVNLSGYFKHGSDECIIYLGYGRYHCE